MSPAWSAFHWCTSPCTSTARSSSWAARRRSAHPTAWSTVRRAHGSSSSAHVVVMNSPSHAALAAPVGRPLSVAGRQIRDAASQRIGSRCSYGNPRAKIDGPSRSRGQGARSWIIAMEDRTTVAVGQAQHGRLVIVDAPASPWHQDLEHGGRSVGHRHGGDERLGALVVAASDLDRPVTLEAAHQIGQVVDPLAVALGDRSIPHHVAQPRSCPPDATHDVGGPDAAFALRHDDITGLISVVVLRPRTDSGGSRSRSSTRGTPGTPT